MKIIRLHFVFLFLAFSGVGNSQTESKTITHETTAYSITYPSKSNFVEYKEEKNPFEPVFSIYDFGDTAISEVSGITLTRLDCSGLEIKTKDIVEITEQGKTVVRSWNENSQAAFDELTYEIDGTTFVKHIYVSKNKIYELTGSIDTVMYQEHYKDIQKIMASFFLK